MTDEQPDALMLADILQHKIPSIKCLEIAAAELRRLHKKCEALTADTIEEMRRITKIYRLETERDELLGLLKEARKIIRASASRNLAKDWDHRTTEVIARVKGERNEPTAN